MPSAFPAWILFTYCVLNSWIWTTLGQGASYQKPLLEIIPSNVIIKGGNFTFRCSGSSTAEKFILYRENQVVRELHRSVNKAEFHFSNAQLGDSATYTCRYNPDSDWSVYSDASNPIKIEVQETFPKPSLQVRPGNVAARGGTLTFHCTGKRDNMRFTLRHMGTTELQSRVEPLGKEAVFTITDVQWKDKGRYDCFYQTKSGATVYSDSSESIDIQVRDLPKAAISFEPVPGVKGDYKILCLAPKSQNVHRFFLYKDTADTPLTDRNVTPGQHSVTFPVSESNAQTCRRCRCSYQIMDSGVLLTSPLSDLVFLADDEQTTPKSTATASDKDETNAPNSTVNFPTNDQKTIIISVVCAALLLFLLLVIAVLYSRRRQKKVKGDVQTKDLCSSEEKAASAPDTMYAPAQKRKSPDATNVPEVRESEESEDQEGLTYVTINPESRKKKTPAQPRSDQDATVYAEVNLR